MKDESIKENRRGIYLLPNLFTTAGLFAGFYAIVAAMKGMFDIAAIAVFIAMIADSLDGRVARLTNTQTAFGAEYDSLSDIVSFGIAPALIMYNWTLYHLGKFGWLAVFLYTAAGALRLARFNTQVGIADKNYFQGLPIPAAAAIISGFVWVGHQYGTTPSIFANSIIACFTVIVAGLMVSTIRYYSFKDFNLKNKVPFIAILIVILIFVAISIDPPEVLFLLFFFYGISGIFYTVISRQKLRRAKKKLMIEKS
ncbi:MAG: hypothetical protein LEGION0398_MBIBDBAK_00047 [Legionellaceae bacterium]